MKIKEAAQLLRWTSEKVELAVHEGVELPKSSERIRLSADGDDFVDIDLECLEEFVKAFEREEPGRHPPIAVRRELLVEAGHRCAVCREHLPLQFHHIIEWAELKHHDPSFMLALCGGCHDKVRLGQIDTTMQHRHKRRLQDLLDVQASTANKLFPEGPSSPLSWSLLAEILGLIHDVLIPDGASAESQYDLSSLDLDEKNALNKLSHDYYSVMKEHDEPFFGRILSFLQNPHNRSMTLKYHEIVDELRRRVAAQQESFDRFELLLEELYHVVCERLGTELEGKRRTLRVFISFMYFNCDVGRKK